MTPAESEIMMDTLGTREDPPDFKAETRHAMAVEVGEHKPTAEPEETVYELCKDATAAGEERVPRNRGRGRGFPKPMVPSARDEDGAVCEH